MKKKAPQTLDQLFAVYVPGDRRTETEAAARIRIRGNIQSTRQCLESLKKDSLRNTNSYLIMAGIRRESLTLEKRCANKRHRLASLYAQYDTFIGSVTILFLLENPELGRKVPAAAL